MMMPANFSAVAENEMTYVVGGSLVDVLAPAMTTANWQNVVTNLITITGNTVLKNYGNTVYTTVFGGDYVPFAVTNKVFNKVSSTYNKAAGSVDSWGAAKGILNAGLVIVQGLAAIYTLGTDTVKINVKDV